MHIVMCFFNLCYSTAELTRVTVSLYNLSILLPLIIIITVHECVHIIIFTLKF